jgi:hypothetical protein
VFAEVLMATKKPRKQLVSIYVDPSVLEKLIKRAESKKWSLSQTASLIVTQEFAPKEAKA